MRSSRWLSGLAAVFLSVPALAEGVFIQPRRTVPADRPSRVYVFFNCTTNIIAGVDGRAEHGRITTRMGTQRRCGRTGQDVLEVYYERSRAIGVPTTCISIPAAAIGSFM